MINSCLIFISLFLATSCFSLLLLHQLRHSATLDGGEGIVGFIKTT